MANIPNIPIWVEFFDLLRELPELWKVKSDVFKDRNKKKIAWEKLLDVYVEIDSNANIDSLKKRMTNIRSCYRRELKKVQRGQRFGAEDGYVPNLWYFTALDFLRDQGMSTSELQDEDKVEQAEEATEAELVPPKSLSQKRKKAMGTHNLLKEAIDQITTNQDTKKDEASIFGESWAASYRKLSPSQQIYAKKAIEDILILGQLELLSLHSVNNHSSSNSFHHSLSSTSPILPHHFLHSVNKHSSSNSSP